MININKMIESIDSMLDHKQEILEEVLLPVFDLLNNDNDIATVIKYIKKVSKISDFDIISRRDLVDLFVNETRQRSCKIHSSRIGEMRDNYFNDLLKLSNKILYAIPVASRDIYSKVSLQEKSINKCLMIINDFYETLSYFIILVEMGREDSVQFFIRFRTNLKKLMSHLTLSGDTIILKG